MRPRGPFGAIPLLLVLASPAAAWIASVGPCSQAVGLAAAPDGDPIVVCQREEGVRVARVDRCDGTVHWRRRLPGGALAVVAMDDGSPIIVTMEVPKRREALYRMVLHRLAPETGARRWSWRSRGLLAFDIGDERPNFIRSRGHVTALPDGDVVMVLPSIAIVRIDGATGVERWTREMPGMSQPTAITTTTHGAIVITQFDARFALHAVRASDGATIWTHDGRTGSERIDSLEPAPAGDVYVAGTDDVEGSPVHVFVARVGGDGTERWRVRPFPEFTAPSPPIRLSVGPADTLLAWGTTNPFVDLPTYGVAALLEASGTTRWRHAVRADDPNGTRLVTAEVRPDGDVVMLARSTYDPPLAMLQRLEPVTGFPRVRLEQFGRAGAVLVDRAERPIVARRAGRALHVVGFGPTPPDCP